MSPNAVALLQGLSLTVVFAILYVAYIRPQRRLLQTHKRMLRDLRPGDQVVTEGGLYARIVQLVDENLLIIELSPSVQLKAKREAIAEVVAEAPVDHAANSVT